MTIVSVAPTPPLVSSPAGRFEIERDRRSGPTGETRRPDLATGRAADER